uniref:Uncharacterized protein n=1 Tax=Macrostomum lignano TaxID=282301 RepID=A0A1I8FMN5_9PLAT
MDTISSWLTCCPVLHIGGGGIGGSSAKADQEDFVPLKNARASRQAGRNLQPRLPAPLLTRTAG